MITFYANGEKISLEQCCRSERRKIKLSDSSFEIELTLHHLNQNFAHGNWMIFYNDYPLANSSSIITSVSDRMFSDVRSEATKAVDDRNELWPHTHDQLPNSQRTRIASTKSDVAIVLGTLSDEMNVKKPPVDHCKIGLKLNDVLELEELHVDRFGGMREGKNGRRRRISRHFLNLGDTIRNVTFGIHDPLVTERTVPDQYSPTYLDALLDALDRKLAVMVVGVPPRVGQRLMGVRYLSSHLLLVRCM